MTRCRARDTVPLALLALVLTLGLAGRLEAREWTQKGFLIGGQGIVHFGDAAAYRRLNDAGIDLVGAGDTLGYAPLDSALLAARTVLRLRDADPRFRLRLLSEVRYPRLRLHQIADHPDPEHHADSLRTTLDSLNRYPSVAGFWLWDEPADPDAMRSAARLSRFISRSSATAPLPFVNLLPSYIGDARQRGPRPDAYRLAWGRDKRSAYARYLAAYLGQYPDMPAPILSVDHYLFESGSFVWDDYFMTLRAATEAAARFGRPGRRIPLWAFVQLSRPRGRAGPGPSLAQVRLAVYGALAYGARGIMYWTLVPSHADPGWDDGLLDGLGRPTDKYDAIRRLNAEVHRLGATLFLLDPVAVLHTALGGQIGIESDLFANPAHPRTPVAAVANGDSACMVGYLRDRGRGGDYLLVVNKDVDAPHSFTLRLAGAADTVYRVSRATGALVRVGSNLRSLVVPGLAPGGGELFRIVRASRVPSPVRGTRPVGGRGAPPPRALRRPSGRPRA